MAPTAVDQASSKSPGAAPIVAGYRQPWAKGDGEIVADNGVLHFSLTGPEDDTSPGGFQLWKDSNNVCNVVIVGTLHWFMVFVAFCLG